MNRIFAATSAPAFDWPDADDAAIHSHHRSLDGAIGALIDRVKRLHPTLSDAQATQIRDGFAEQGTAFRLDLRDRWGDALDSEARDLVNEVLYVEPIDLVD